MGTAGKTWVRRLHRGGAPYRVLDELDDRLRESRAPITIIALADKLDLDDRVVARAVYRLRDRGLIRQADNEGKKGRWEVVYGTYCEGCLTTRGVAWKESAGEWLCDECAITSDLELTGGFR